MFTVPSTLLLSLHSDFSACLAQTSRVGGLFQHQGKSRVPSCIVLCVKRRQICRCLYDLILRLQSHIDIYERNLGRKLLKMSFDKYILILNVHRKPKPEHTDVSDLTAFSLPVGWQGVCHQVVSERKGISSLQKEWWHLQEEQNWKCKASKVTNKIM